MKFLIFFRGVYFCNTVKMVDALFTFCFHAPCCWVFAPSGFCTYTIAPFLFVVKPFFDFFQNFFRACVAWRFAFSARRVYLYNSTIAPGCQVGAQNFSFVKMHKKWPHTGGIFWEVKKLQFGRVSCLENFHTK